MENETSGSQQTNAKTTAISPGIYITRATGRIYLDPRDAAENPFQHQKRGEDGKRLCGGIDKCTACRLYRILDDTGRDVVRVMNAATRKLWQLDGQTLDDFRINEKGTPKAKEWPVPNVEGKDQAPQSAMYRFIRSIAPNIASGIAATLSDKVIKKWKETRWDALVREIKSPPHFRKGYPIPIRAQSFKLELVNKREIVPDKQEDLLADDDKRALGKRANKLDDITGRSPAAGPQSGIKEYRFKFSISPGRHDGSSEFSIPIRPRDQYQAKILYMLAHGQVGKSAEETTVKIGEAKIAEDKRHRGKWMVTFSYTSLIPNKKTGEITAGINRGIICFLAAVTSTGKSWIYDGYDIETGLKRFQARRKRFQYDAKASGRSGHGRAHILKPIEYLEGKGKRWRQSRCQTIAVRFVEWLIQQNVTKLYMEDLSGIRNGELEKLKGGKLVWDRIQEWPYYQLGQRIVAVCEETGIKVVERPAAYNSQHCPKCDYTAEENIDISRRQFRCMKCRYKRHLDLVAAENIRVEGQRVEEQKDDETGRSEEG